MTIKTLKIHHQFHYFRESDKCSKLMLCEDNDIVQCFYVKEEFLDDDFDLVTRVYFCGTNLESAQDSFSAIVSFIKRNYKYVTNDK